MAEKARDLAEGMGFEPTILVSQYNGLAIRHSDGGDSPDNGETPSPMRVTEEREKRDNGAFGHGVAAHPGAHSDQGLTPTHIARFWSKVDVGRDNSCWAWEASTDRHGYGQFKPSSKHNPLRAHRVAYELVRGPANDELALHSCGNPACCNPSHLRLGDQADNHRDREKHGRSRRTSRGSWRAAS